MPQKIQIILGVSLFVLSFFLIVVGLIQNKESRLIKFDDSTQVNDSKPNQSEELSNFFDKDINFEEESNDPYYLTDPFKDICSQTLKDGFPVVNSNVVCLR